MIIKNNLKFSIVIPVYNIEQYIDKCLTSIINQTYKNFEAIIVNDGSTDNSQSIINKYVKKDNRFKCYVQENKGLSEARNFGVSKTTGDILIFVDGDDFIDYDLLDILKEEFTNFPELDVVSYHLKLVNQNGTPYESPTFKIFPPSKVTDVYSLLLYSNYADMSILYAYKLDFYKKK